MPVRTRITQPDGVFFITFTCADWIPLFSIAGHDVVYNWFDHLRQSGHYIVGYVVMPHHVHALVAFRNSGKSINSIISAGKRFMAYELVARLAKLNRGDILDKIKGLRSATEEKEGKLHKVFEPSFDWKECRTHRFIIQKLNYIHGNPCKGNKPVKLPEEYEHSSARYYFTGQHAAYKVTSYMELEDVDLTAPL